jgi:hypothetical protein
MPRTVYPGLESVQDATLRSVLKNVFDMVGALQQQATGIGAVSKPLDTHLDAGTNRLTNVANPVADQDAVTLVHLKRYVEDRLTAVGVIDPSSGQSTVGGDCPETRRRPPMTALDTASMTAAYTASFTGLFGGTPSGVPGSGTNDTGYWVGVSNHYGKFSDGWCRAGWSRYWERKLAGDVTVDPGLGDLPAVYHP